MMKDNIFIEGDKDFERRNHGCDGCRKGVPTERFDGYCGSHLWLCHSCYKEIVSEGLKKKKQDENEKPKIVILDDNELSVMKYAEEYPENWKKICEELDKEAKEKIDKKLQWKKQEVENNGKS